MLANGAAGARHLAENAHVVRYEEGPAEKIERWLNLYVEKSDTLSANEFGDWMADVGKKNSKLAQILHCTETRAYLGELEEFSPHFMVDEIYGQKFCLEFLHDVNGGVSGTNI